MSNTEGYTIALAAPSRFCTQDQVEQISDFLTGLGFKVHVPDGILARDGQLAGTVEHRADLMNELLRDASIDAILCVRGGYGAGQLLPFLQAPQRDKTPLLCGFSDTTALHCWMQQQGLTSLHCPVGTTLLTAEQSVVEHFVASVKGEISQFQAESEGWVTGSTEGVLVGGNLSVLYSLRGTPYFPNLEGKILFLEDLDEMLYHVDRMLNNFHLSEEWDKLNGVILGQFSDMRDNTKEFGFSSDNPFGYNVEEILRRYFGDLKIPVAFGFPAGHEPENMALHFGRKIRLEVTSESTRIEYH